MKSSNNVDPNLNITLFDTFQDDFEDFSDEPFSLMVWMKVIFFAGFAVSHFSIGFLADYLGHWKVMKLVAKGLVVFGIAATLSCKFTLLNYSGVHLRIIKTLFK